MIRAILLSEQGQFNEGGAELIERWRQEANARLWLDIEDPQASVELLAELGCDESSIRDSLRKRHPPRVEQFEHYTFVLFRGIAALDEHLNLDAQQLGLWVGESILITIRRGQSVSIQHWWEQQRATQTLPAPGELALRLLYFASGRYLERLLQFEDQLGELEDGMLMEQSESEMRELVIYRSRLRKLRRIFNYHQRLAEEIWRGDCPLLGAGEDDSLPQRRDLFERCERLHSLCAMYYEICGDLVEGYISLSSHRLNHTMKILTIITAIFVPLGFMAGLYGMNFEYMPELGWKYAYFVLLSVMATLAGTMMFLFRRFKWW